MTNCNDEVIIKIIGKLTLENSNIDQLKIRELLEEVLYEYDVVSKEKSLMVSDIEEKAQIYLASKQLEGLSKNTLYSYKLNLQIFSDYIHKPIISINAADIRMFLVNRCKYMKPSSINGQIYTLKSFFKWLFREEYIVKNPMDKIKPVKEPKRVRSAMTDEEIELLKQVCKSDREKCIIEFLISTGCRLSEIVNINKKDINWYEMSLFVVGKGDKQRKVYFNVKTKILLQKYLKAREDNNPALFVTIRYPHNRLGGRSIEREVKKIADRANFNKSVYPHLFRHSYATHNINSGMSLTVLQELMGHENPSTTLIYSEISQENIRYEYKRAQ